MSDTPAMPQFERFDQVLQSIGLDVGASEIHGVISGILCAGHSDAHAAWFVELFKDRSDDDLLVVEARQLLGQLYQSTQGYIEGEDLNFTPFLPDDELEIEVRAKALSEWCQGYLYGLGLAGITETQLKDEAGEAIRDITEFTRLDNEDIEPGEEAELAYVELEEFLRVAVLLIREALTGKREKGNDSE